jgi:hypothetical protein
VKVAAAQLCTERAAGAIEQLECRSPPRSQLGAFDD